MLHFLLEILTIEEEGLEKGQIKISSVSIATRRDIRSRIAGQKEEGRKVKVQGRKKGNRKEENPRRQNK